MNNSLSARRVSIILLVVYPYLTTDKTSIMVLASSILFSRTAFIISSDTSARICPPFFSAPANALGMVSFNSPSVFVIHSKWSTARGDLYIKFFFISPALSSSFPSPSVGLNFAPVSALTINFAEFEKYSRSPRSLIYLSI